MGLMASHAAMAAPMQERRRSRWILLVIGLLARPAAFVASCSFHLSRMGYVVDLGTTGSGARHRSGSRWGAQVEPGASTRCWHGAPLVPVVVIANLRASIGHHSYL